MIAIPIVPEVCFFLFVYCACLVALFSNLFLSLIVTTPTTGQSCRRTGGRRRCVFREDFLEAMENAGVVLEDSADYYLRG